MVVVARFTSGQAGNPAMPQLVETGPPFIAVSGLLSVSVQAVNPSVVQLTTVDCPALIGVGFTSNVRNLPVMVMGELVQVPVLYVNPVTVSVMVTEPVLVPLVEYCMVGFCTVSVLSGALPDQS